MPGVGTKQQKASDSTTFIPTAGDLQASPGAVLSDFEQLCVALPVSGALIAVRDLAGMRCTVSFGNAPSVGSQLPTDSCFAVECFETGEVALSEDAQIDPRMDSLEAARLGFRSAAAVPIHAQGSVVGLIEVFCSEPSAFPHTAIAGLQRVAKSFAALMIFDAANGGQPVIGGPLDHPIILPRLVADQELVPLASPTGDRPAADASEGPESGEGVEEPESRQVSRDVAARGAASTSQLPSDRPTPPRVWLIAGVLLLVVSLLFLFLLRGVSRSENTSIDGLNPRDRIAQESSVDE
jgi:hypothetical protein